MTGINKLQQKIDQVKAQRRRLAFGPAFIERTEAGWEWYFDIGRIGEKGLACDIEYIQGVCETREEAENAVDEALMDYKPAYGSGVTVLIDDIGFEEVEQWPSG